MDRLYYGVCPMHNYVISYNAAPAYYDGLA
jgi:hypothetical protein